MPFKSEKQRRFMHANHPRIAKRWEEEKKRRRKRGGTEAMVSAIKKARSG
jgi:hypothetical protein